jgi:hypothetical protein
LGSDRYSDVKLCGGLLKSKRGIRDMKGHFGLRTSLMAVMGLVTLSGAAVADMVTSVGTDGQLTLGYSATATGPNSGSPSTTTGNPTSSTGGVAVNDLTGNPSSNYSFTNSFTLPSNASFTGTIQGYPYNFSDSYVVDIPTAQSSAYIFSLNFTAQLGIQDLSARLYTYSAGGVQNLTLGGTGAVNGTVAGPWSPDENGAVASTTLIDAQVPAGEYVLQVVGLQTGTLSGMYNGSFAVTPVPVPAGLPLLLSGLGGLGIWSRRRR